MPVLGRCIDVIGNDLEAAIKMNIFDIYLKHALLSLSISSEKTIE